MRHLTYALTAALGLAACDMPGAASMDSADGYRQLATVEDLQAVIGKRLEIGENFAIFNADICACWGDDADHSDH